MLHRVRPEDELRRLTLSERCGESFRNEKRRAGARRLRDEPQRFFLRDELHLELGRFLEHANEFSRDLAPVEVDDGEEVLGALVKRERENPAAVVTTSGAIKRRRRAPRSRSNNRKSFTVNVKSARPIRAPGPEVYQDSRFQYLTKKSDFDHNDSRSEG